MPLASSSSVITGVGEHDRNHDRSGRPGRTIKVSQVGVSKYAERLIGEAPSDTLIGEVAANVAEQIDPVDDMRGPAWYKRRITRVLVERALKCALQRANDNRTPD